MYDECFPLMQLVRVYTENYYIYYLFVMNYYFLFEFTLYLNYKNFIIMKKAIFILFGLISFFCSCGSDQLVSPISNASTEADLRSSNTGTCGCEVQYLDPCCYRIKCTYDRYVVFGIDGCSPAGSGYNTYNIPGTNGQIGNYTTICSPYGGTPMLYIHDVSGRCGSFDYCSLWGAPDGCSNPVCDLDKCN